MNDQLGQVKVLEGLQRLVASGLDATLAICKATYPDNWHFRVEFYGAKWEAYKQRSPSRWPTKRTVRRWVKECNEAIRNSTQYCSERSDE